MNRLLQNFEHQFSHSHLNFLKSNKKIKIINGHQNSLRLTLSAINLAKSNSNRIVILSESSRFEPFHQQISTSFYGTSNSFEFVHGFLKRQTDHLENLSKNTKLITLQNNKGLQYMPHLDKQTNLHVIIDLNELKNKSLGLNKNTSLFPTLDIKELVIINRLSGKDSTQKIIDKLQKIYKNKVLDDIEVFDFSKKLTDCKKLKAIWLPHEIESDNEHRLKIVDFLKTTFSSEENYSLSSSSVPDFMKFSDEDCLNYDILMGMEAVTYSEIDNFVITSINDLLKLQRSTLTGLLHSVKKNVFLCITQDCKYELDKLQNLLQDNNLIDSWNNGEIESLKYYRDPMENQALNDLKIF